MNVTFTSCVLLAVLGGSADRWSCVDDAGVLRWQDNQQEIDTESPYCYRGVIPAVGLKAGEHRLRLDHPNLTAWVLDDFYAKPWILHSCLRASDTAVHHPGELSYPWNAPSQSGDFISASQEADVLPVGKQLVRFRERDDFTADTVGYHFKQFQVNDEVVWEQDVAGGTPAWQPIEVNISISMDVPYCGHKSLPLHREQPELVSLYSARFAKKTDAGLFVA